MWKPWKLCDEWFCNDAFFKTTGLFKLDASVPESRPRSNIVNMLLYMSWYVIFFTRNIMSSRDVFPKKELRDKEVLSFSGCRIKLNPLKTRTVSNYYIPGTADRKLWSTCLLADIAKRSELIPDATSHSVTALVVDTCGAKKSTTSSAVICLP